MHSERQLITVCRCGNAIILVCLSLFFFLAPGGIVIRDLLDPSLRSATIPRMAWRWHRDLTPKYERWAQARLQSDRAAVLSTADISGTEWPLFGSVFYLWATESLQAAWETNHALAAVAPRDYAAGAIKAATQLVVDPKQANWVKLHWGNKYLTNENVFYRLLVIAALTSHARLTADRQYLPLLRDQVESLSAELEASPKGLLEDYPGECYPGDVMTAIAMIRKADPVLGTDHGPFVRRALRGFQNKALDPRGLVPYRAHAALGQPLGPARGCGNSYVSLSAPSLWPEQARRWYDLYSAAYWQEVWGMAGFREFPKDMPGHEWYMDVDAGPVLKGFGCAACAFGLGAARVNGHFEQAYPLAAQMLAVCWPLPTGTLLFPRGLSNAADAPYLGEAAILYNLTRLPAAGIPVRTGGSMPVIVWIFPALQLGLGLAMLGAAFRSFKPWRQNLDPLGPARPRLQFGAWLGLLLATLVLLACGKVLFAALALVCAQLFPRPRRPETALVTTVRRGPRL